MPLHPKIQRMLSRMPQLPPEPELSALGVSEVRRLLNVSSSLPKLALARVEDACIRLSDRELGVRIYAASDERDLPCAVYFHGGGFVVGTIDTHDGICRKLAAASGVKLVSVDYRLAPEHPFPAAAEDAYASVTWLAEHGRSLGVDGSRLAVLGDSAGGNLATVACLMARDRGGPAIRHQALIYPVLDARCDAASYDAYGRGLMLTSDLMRWLYRKYLRGTDGEHPYASPLRAKSLAALPSCSVITAEHDVLRDEALAYVERLRAADVAVTHRHCADLVHGFAAMWQSVEPAALALEWLGARVAAALRS